MGRLALILSAGLLVSAGLVLAQDEAPAAPVLVLDRTLLCATIPSGGVNEIEVRVNAGSRQGTTQKILAFAVVRTGGVRRAADMLDESMAWVAAGKYDHSTNLSPSAGPVLFNATRFGTLALNRRTCTPSKARVPLSGQGLRATAAGPLGVTFDCETPRRVLVRLRAVAHSSLGRYREEGFEKTKASLQSGYLAVRTQAGRQLAFAAVFDTGKARLFTASNCIED